MDRDLMALLDELENVISDASHIPLTGRIVLDEEKLFEHLDRLRAGIPEALLQAQRITRERERLLSQAREEAEATIKEAQAYAEKLIRESAILQRAQQESDELIEEARQVSREIRLGAREYADDLFGKMEANIQKMLQIIRQGRDELGPGPKLSSDDEAAATNQP